MLLSEIAQAIGAELDAPADRSIESIQSIDRATSDALTFLAAGKQPPALDQLHAAAVIVAPDVERDLFPKEVALLRMDNPHLGFALALGLLSPEPEAPFEDVSPQAFVDPTATIGADVAIAPGAWIGPRVTVGTGSVLYPGVSIAEDCVIGAHCTLFANVSVYAKSTLGERVRIHSGTTVGSDGFGYAKGPRGSVKIPHRGRVVIGDDVEIGANVAIDRGVLDHTVIGTGAKIDNLVQIGHNCIVGPHSIICGQAGMAGSGELGVGVVIAGQVGVGGHLKVGDGATVGAKSGVTTDLPAGGEYLGYPATDARTARRAMAILYRLPELRRHVDKISRQLDELLGT
ncbi:MAG: UDP-3-O-(3-hydroxymyristoyl)glucosamine N-acyltransferase [Planctomycetota bacterium]